MTATVRLGCAEGFRVRSALLCTSTPTAPAGEEQRALTVNLLEQICEPQNLIRAYRYWRLQGKGKEWRAEVVAYADDFVILSRGHAEEARSGRQG